MGRGGCSRSDFFSMSIAEMSIYINGMMEREKSEWNRTRQLMWSVLQPYMKKKQTPQELFPFSWEQPEEEELTQEDREAIIAQGRAFERQMIENERIHSNETHP